jgi:tetratricopeptide (TPR) repeat protein
VIASAERYVKTDSGDADVWLILGDCRRRERSFEKAVQAYVAASKTREAQGKKGLLQAAALLQEELGQPQQALGLIDSFLKSKPERMLEAAALVRKARALTALGQKREAAAVLKDTVKRLPDTPSAVEANRLLESL